MNEKLFDKGFLCSLICVIYIQVLAFYDENGVGLWKKK